MGCVEELRRLVGHRPLLLVGAAVLALDPESRILLFRRTDNGMWCIPGGALEPGETLEETARREAREEAGVELGPLELFHVFSGPDQFHVYPNGDQVHNVSVVYVARDVLGEPRADGVESSEARFFALSELPEDVSPPVRPVLQRFAASSVTRAP